MSVTVRTNQSTNPTVQIDATNWAAVAGTGGTASGARNSGAGYDGTGFYRVSWTVATTAVSGGFTHLITGRAASTAYSDQVWVRSSKIQRVQLKADYRNASNTVVNTATGTAVVLAANTWTLITVSGTSGAAVTNTLLTAQAVTGTSGVNWANGDTFDGDFVTAVAEATPGAGFNGNTVDAGAKMYDWTSTAGASTSTETTYTPALALVAQTDSPCPRIEVTISDLTPTDNTVNLWATADGVRVPVRGAKGLTVTGSGFVTDYEAPLGRTVTYDLEITSGLTLGAVTPSQSATITPPVDSAGKALWWIQDPLVPGSALALAVTRGDSTRPTLTSAAVKALEYESDISIIPVAGSALPVAIGGQRMAASGVDFSMFTRTAQATTNLRNLLKQTSTLLIRPPGARNDGITGQFYAAIPRPKEHPVTVAFGGTLTRWSIEGSSVAAPAASILVPVWTYGDVQALWTTYQQAQTALAAKTYLQVLKSPTGA